MNRNTIKTVLALLVILGASIGIGFCAGVDVDYAKQKELLGNLQTVGAVVFGIIGAWIAIVYPETLRLLASPYVVGYRDKARTYTNLLAPLLMSGFVFISVLLCAPIGAVIQTRMDVQCTVAESKSQCLEPFQEWMFSVVCFLTIIQILAILKSMGPIFETRRTISQEAERREENRALHSEIKQPGNLPSPEA